MNFYFNPDFQINEDDIELEKLRCETVTELNAKCFCKSEDFDPYNGDECKEECKEECKKESKEERSKIIFVEWVPSNLRHDRFFKCKRSKNRCFDANGLYYLNKKFCPYYSDIAMNLPRHVYHVDRFWKYIKIYLILSVKQKCSMHLI